MEMNMIQPVVLDRYEDFEHYARKAAIVTYRPDYYRGPFLDDKKRLRRVTFTAVGVSIRGVSLNFSYTLSYEDLFDPRLSWDVQADVIEDKISAIIESLRSECGLVRGGIASTASLGETLMVRP